MGGGAEPPSRETNELLSGVGAALSHSSDLGQLLPAVSAVVVPALADLFVVELLVDGAIVAVGVGRGFAVGVGAEDTYGHAVDLGRHAGLPVAVVIEAVVLELLFADVPEDRDLAEHVVDLVDDVVGGVELPVIRPA